MSAFAAEGKKTYQAAVISQHTLLQSSVCTLLSDVGARTPPRALVPLLGTVLAIASTASPEMHKASSRDTGQGCLLSSV